MFLVTEDNGIRSSNKNVKPVLNMSNFYTQIHATVI